MKSESLEKIRKVAAAEEEELQTRLRRIAAGINELSESINIWKGHLVRVDTELRRQLVTGIGGGQILLMLRQKESIRHSIAGMEWNIGELNRDFDNLARELTEKRNRTAFIDGKITEAKRRMEQSRETRTEKDITELWAKRRKVG